MAQAQKKFEFGTSFDPGATEQEQRVAAKYNDDELAAARTQAYEEGHAAGLGAVLQSEERRIVELLSAIAGKADDLAAEFDNHVADHRTQAQNLGILVCRKILPALAERHGLAEIEGLITECLGKLPNEPRVVVRIGVTNLPKLQERIDRIAAGASEFFGKIVLLADDDLSSTDCRIVWADGGAERDVKKHLADIDEVIDRHLDPAPQPTDNPSPPPPIEENIKENTEESTGAQQAPAAPVDVAST